MLASLSAAACMALAHGQTATSAPETTGSVSGHVYCADTNEPARFATVALQAAPVVTDTSLQKRLTPVVRPVTPATRTGLDGSFHFSAVRPGTYFLIADYPGYISPIAKLSAAELKSKEPSDIEKVEKLLVKVTVAANKDSTSEIELERGAAIAGTVRYDDGSSANEIQIAVLRLRDDGRASKVSVNLTGQARSAFDLRNQGLETNDLGHYRISGLPAGKYIVMTTFPTVTSSFRGLLGGPPATDFRIDESVALSVYSGNVFREKDAKPVEVTTGSERDDADITIPLLGLHTISGSVTALADGHPVNEGTISLVFADDKSELRSSVPLDNDGRFNLRFVPEGEYILRVTNPADMTEQQIKDPEIGGKYVALRNVHMYASVDLPISVRSDLSNVTISVPDKPASTAQKQ